MGFIFYIYVHHRYGTIPYGTVQYCTVPYSIIMNVIRITIRINAALGPSQGFLLHSIIEHIGDSKTPQLSFASPFKGFAFKILTVTSANIFF